MSLRLCADCNRHVRDATCPFCGATASTAIPQPHSRATRAAMVFGAATMVTAAMACGGETSTSDAGSDASPAPTETAVPAYGAPVPTTDAAPVQPDGGPVAAYGAPPPDAGAVPPYGAPPPDGGR